MQQARSKRLWQKHLALPTSRTREALINHYLHLVSLTVTRLGAGLRSGVYADLEDGRGAGYIGLCKAVDKFREDGGAKFETYAICLIRGAILENQREADWVPRTVRDMGKQIEAARHYLLTETETEPATEDIRDALGYTEQAWGDMAALLDRQMVVSLNTKTFGGAGDNQQFIEFVDLLASADEPLEVIAEQNFMRDMLHAAIRRLPPRERCIVTMYALHNETMREIAEAVSLSETRVLQLYRASVEKIKSWLIQEEGEA